MGFGELVFGAKRVDVCDGSGVRAVRAGRVVAMVVLRAGGKVCSCCCCFTRR